jgi:hypothetical protein
MSLTAYIRYDNNNRIVPGGPIVVKEKPNTGNWQVVTEGNNVTLSGKLRAFVKVDRFGKPIAGSLFLGYKRPATGQWIEVNATYEGPVSPTTTTTTSTSTSTTTTTTTVAYDYRIGYTVQDACSGTGDVLYRNDAYGNGNNMCSNAYITVDQPLPYSVGAQVYVYGLKVSGFKVGTVEDSITLNIGPFGCGQC